MWRHTHPEAPWMNRYAVAALDRLVRPSDFVVEFGSGRSTPWLSERAASMVSLETDPDWHQCITEQVDPSVVDVRLSASDPTSYLEALSDIEHVDVAVIDGIHRELAALWALRRVSSACGLIVIDDAHRYLPTLLRVPYKRRSVEPEWKEFVSKAGHWRTLWTSDGVQSTAFFFSQLSP